jgi:glucose/mannose-6-phosphate isomerase
MPGRNRDRGADGGGMILDRRTVARIDPQGMLDLVARFPAQCEEAVQIAQKAAIGTAHGPFRGVVVGGMGGSAIAGDILRSALLDTLDLPFLVVRNYQLPRAVGQGTLVFCSSYSGNTEETLALYEDARRKRCRVICLTSGGKLAEKCSRDGVPWIRIPGGLPPRAALGYLFVPMLATLWRLEVVPPRWGELEEVMLRVREAGERCAIEVPDEANIAKQLAKKLHGHILVVHASADLLDAAAVRWKGQLAENAKVLAFHNAYPELNHNEVVGWTGPHGKASACHVIVLRDPEDSERIQRRMEVTSAMILGTGAKVSQVWSGQGSRLARLFSLIHLGDYVSVYLAALARVNPTPVETIDLIKERLAQAEAGPTEVPRP